MKKIVKQPGRGKSRRAIFPPALAKGDTIGLVAPAGPILNRDNFTAGIHILEEKGFRVKYNPKILHARGYLAGSDQDRADEFNRLWSDPEVKGLVAARGGYGCLRLLDLLDMKQFRQNPKILVGFSDLTVLLAEIHQKTGLVTYHGPVLTTLANIDKQSQKSFFNVLAGKTTGLLKPSGVKVLKPGRTKGILLGGNLTTLVHTIATPYEISWDKAIVLVEDIGEAPYRLDRLITHLSRAQRLQKVKGLILGTFCDDGRKENNDMGQAVQRRIIELLAGYDIPVWANFPVGHGRRNLTLPIGAVAEMDSSSGTLHFLGN
jgi:muramoyltetrapeptide carboxypeptidase